MTEPTWTERVARDEWNADDCRSQSTEAIHASLGYQMAAKCDRLEALLREAMALIEEYYPASQEELIIRARTELGDA